MTTKKKPFEKQINVFGKKDFFDPLKRNVFISFISLTAEEEKKAKELKKKDKSTLSKSDSLLVKRLDSRDSILKTFRDHLFRGPDQDELKAKNTQNQNIDKTEGTFRTWALKVQAIVDYLNEKTNQKKEGGEILKSFLEDNSRLIKLRNTFKSLVNNGKFDESLNWKLPDDTEEQEQLISSIVENTSLRKTLIKEINEISTNQVNELINLVKKETDKPTKTSEKIVQVGVQFKPEFTESEALLNDFIIEFVDDIDKLSNPAKKEDIEKIESSIQINNNIIHKEKKNQDKIMILE